MPLTISNNSAVASASYYLDKNQKALQMSIKRLASGKRIVSPNEDPGTLGGDEAKRGGQPIVWSEKQCAERYLIRRGAGWRARDRWPDRRSYGGTQRYGHTGSDEKLAGCAVLQQRVCGPAETTARCFGPNLQWSKSVRGFRDWFRRKSHRYTSRVPREHLGRQHHRDIHQQRRVLRYQDKSIQISSAIRPNDRCKRPDQGQYIMQARPLECIWFVRKQFRRDYIARQVDYRWECSNRHCPMSLTCVLRPEVVCPA